MSANLDVDVVALHVCEHIAFEKFITFSSRVDKDALAQQTTRKAFFSL